MKSILKCGLVLLLWQTGVIYASTTVTNIAAGLYHSLFLKSDGSLWAMGYNAFGQLGDGTLNNTIRPEKIVSGGVVAVATGSEHSLFLKSDGSLWVMGYNVYGQLGDNTFNNIDNPEQIVSSNVVAIATGISNHSLFLKSDGSLWAMGYNAYGQLGDGTFNNTNRPEQIVPSGVVTITAGNEHSLFLKSNGSLWATGYNLYGQLGDGFTNSTAMIPEQIYPSPQPVLTNSISSTTNLQFKAACQFGGTFYLLAGTNLIQPLSQWASVATNCINNRNNNLFSATLTNAVNASASQIFYILQSQ